MTTTRSWAQTRRIGIVGIDGAGKSTVMQRLRETAAPESLVLLTCPDFHETDNAPLHTLSRQLRWFSDGADVMGHPTVKAAALYLQMTLYGPTERFMIDTFQPRLFVSERHPIVESLVYGPVYEALGSRERPDTDHQERIREILDGFEPGTMDAVLGWYAREAARLGADPDIWSVLTQVSELGARGLAAAIDGFGARYRTTLPDDIVWLDVPPDLAARRCAARAGDDVAEVHETVEGLTALRSRYLEVADTLRKCLPRLRFRIFQAEDDTDLRELVAFCLTPPDAADV